MSDILKDLMSSGKRLLSDTKQRTLQAPAPTKNEKKSLRPIAEGSGPETNPHKIFIKRVIAEKPKKSVIIEKFQKFCDEADENL